jgi:hypothetical protein
MLRQNRNQITKKSKVKQIRRKSIDLNAKCDQTALLSRKKNLLIDLGSRCVGVLLQYSENRCDTFYEILLHKTPDTPGIFLAKYLVNLNGNTNIKHSIFFYCTKQFTS